MTLRAGTILPLLALLALLALPAGRAAAADWDEKIDFEPIEVTGLNPADIDPGRLQPGLLPFYYREFFERHLDQLPATRTSRYRSFAGEPIPQLDHDFGEGEVFGAGSGRGVGIRMTGFLHFPEAGVYELQALSNDGIILMLDGQVVLNDPEQHSDRMSNAGIIDITAPGWYPLVLEYFQRKGTAALKLFWKPPGAAEMAVVPAAGYAHLP